MFRLRLLCLLALGLGPVSAATWDGGLSHNNFTVNDLWSTGNNWVDGVPLSSAVTDLTFALSGARTTSSQNLGDNFTLRSLTFAAGSNVTAVTGNSLIFAANARITQDSGTAVRVAQNLNFTAEAIVSGSGSGRLTLEGGLSGAQLRIFGGLGSPATLLVTLANANTFGGLNLGTSAAGCAPVDLTLVDNLSAGLQSITFFNGNTLRLSGTRTLSNPVTLASQANNLPNVFTIGAGGDLQLTGSVTFNTVNKTLRIDNALTTLAGNLSGSALVSKAGSGTLSLAGLDNSAFVGTWKIDAGRLLLKNGNASSAGRIVLNVDDGLDLNQLATVSIGGLAGTGALALGATTLVVGNTTAAAQPYLGAITSAAPNQGTIRVVGAGHELLLQSGTSSFGYLNAETASVRLDGAQISLGGGAGVGSNDSVPGSLTLVNGARLTLTHPSSTLNVTGPAGTLVTVSGTASQLTAGLQIVVTGTGTATAQLKVDGGATSATFTVIGAASSTGSGAMEVLNGGRVTDVGGILGISNGSPGQARIGGTGSIWINQTLGLGGFSQSFRGGVGTLLIEEGGTVETQAGTTLWTRGSRIDVAGGRLFTGSLTAEDINVTLAVSDPDEFNSALVIGTDGSSSVYSGALTNSFTAPGGLTKTGLGQLTLTGALSFTGRTRVQQGSMRVPNSNLFATLLDLDPATTFTFSGVWGSNGVSHTTIAGGAILRGDGTLRGSVDNAGLIEVVGSQSLLLSGPVQNSGRIRVASGASFGASQSLTNSGVIDLISAGSITLPANFINQGRVLDRHSLSPTVSVAGGNAVIHATGFAGHTYRLQRADALTGAFSDLGSAQMLTADGPVAFVDTTPPAGTAFYRIQVD